MIVLVLCAYVFILYSIESSGKRLPLSYAEEHSDEYQWPDIFIQLYTYLLELK